MDILQRLESRVRAADASDWARPSEWVDSDLYRELVDAIVEIKRLRALAGAVSAGPSAAEVMKPLRHGPPEA